MLNSITIDWIITNKCNLDCYYCLMGENKNMSVSAVNSKFINSLTESYLFHLTGGEPFLVPNFIEICEQLIENNQYISINTNLTRNVDSFINKIKPKKVTFINCSIHYPFRKKHMEPFLRHYNRLRKSGFFVFASLVMIPELFDEILDFWREFHKEIEIFPKMMRGISNKKLYPKNYGDFQKESIRNMTVFTAKKLFEIDKYRFDILCRKSVSMDDWETGIIPEGNEICINGYSLIRITESGDIMYCKNRKIGNVYTDGLQSLQKIHECPYRILNKNKRYTCNYE